MQVGLPQPPVGGVLLCLHFGHEEGGVARVHEPVGGEVVLQSGHVHVVEERYGTALVITILS